MYTYEINGLKAIIYKNGDEISVVGPWAEDNPNGPKIWAEAFCEDENAKLLNPELNVPAAPVNVPAEDPSPTEE